MSGAELVRNLGKPKRQTKISKQAAKWAQWLIPNTFHNIRVFMICRNGHTDLHNMHVDFAQWVHGFSNNG
jgi:hypothetical protein